MSFQNTRPNLYVSTKFTKELKIGKLLPEWRPSAFFKILSQINFFPQRSKKNGKLKGFHQNGDQVSFQNTRKNLFFSTKVTKKMKIERGFHLNGDQVPFQNTISNLFISTKVTKELNIGRLSPKWRLSVFSKYSIKFICFHKGQNAMLKISKTGCGADL